MSRAFIFMVLLIVSGCSSQSDESISKKNNQKTSIAATEEKRMSENKKVTGVGGIFFKVKDPNLMKDWYSKNLGFKTNEYGATFEFRDIDEPDKVGSLQWSPFSEKTKYFEPSQKDFMINYRVADLETLLQELKANGVEIVGEMVTYDFGKFAHILDPEGNKIELWEPVDTVITDSNEN